MQPSARARARASQPSATACARARRGLLRLQGMGHAFAGGGGGGGGGQGCGAPIPVNSAARSMRNCIEGLGRTHQSTRVPQFESRAGLVQERRADLRVPLRWSMASGPALHLRCFGRTLSLQRYISCSRKGGEFKFIPSTRPGKARKKLKKKASFQHQKVCGHRNLPPVHLQPPTASAFGIWALPTDTSSWVQQRWSIQVLIAAESAHSCGPIEHVQLLKVEYSLQKKWHTEPVAQ